MSKKKNTEYLNCLKESSKEFIEGIGTESKLEESAIEMIYGFTHRLFVECEARKGGQV